MSGTFASSDRLSHLVSFFVVDVLFGGGLALAAAFALWKGVSLWLRARRLVEGVWHHAGLRTGRIVLSGTAHRASDVTPSGALVELTITQNGVEHHSRDPYVEWTEVSRQLVEYPFRLRTSEGTDVLVRPDAAIDLIDRLEPPQPMGPMRRTRTARVTEGESIWIEGELRSEYDASADPYRGGGAQWVLTASDTDLLVVSSKPVGADLRRTSMFYFAGALAIVGLASLFQLVVFAEFRDLRAHGVTEPALITNREEWHPQTKHGRQDHYYWVVDYDTARGKLREKVEVGYRAYQEHNVGDRVPITYARAQPHVLQAGPAADVGLTTDSLIITAACAFVIALLISRRKAVSRKLKWSRREALVERVPGTL